jgi:leucine zipper transcription factor-like protein 1
LVLIFVCVLLKELEKKVSQTAPFQNLKAMVQKKNDQLKDLRKRLSKYESVDD